MFLYNGADENLDKTAHQTPAGFVNPRRHSLLGEPQA